MTDYLHETLRTCVNTSVTIVVTVALVTSVL